MFHGSPNPVRAIKPDWLEADKKGEAVPDLTREARDRLTNSKRWDAGFNQHLISDALKPRTGGDLRPLMKCLKGWFENRRYAFAH
jgi:hypothetical protein